MIRFPKRKPQSEQLDEADILETEEVSEAVRTSELMAVDLDDADLLLDRPPSQQNPEGVGQVMASLEAEMSRALSDGAAAWVAPREGSATGASAHPAQPLTTSSFQSSPPPAPESRSRFGASPSSVRPGPASVPPAPASVRPIAPAPQPSSPFSAPAPSQGFVVAPHVVVPAAASSTALLGQGPPHGQAPHRNEPTVVVVREKPGFSWVIASLALGALAAIVGMRVASGLGKPGGPTAGQPASSAPSAATVASVASPSTGPGLSGSTGLPAVAPTISPEALLSASPPRTEPSGAVVAFDDKDAVHVNVEARPVMPQAPAPAPAPAPSTSTAASASAKSAPSATPTAKPGDPPPLVPDPPSKPVVVAPTPPPAAPAKARAKTPEEQLLEAQLKAAQR